MANRNSSFCRATRFALVLRRPQRLSIVTFSSQMLLSSSLFLFAKAGKNAEKKCRDPTRPINNGQVEGQVTKLTFGLNKTKGIPILRRAAS